MMELASLPMLKHVLEVIHTANDCVDCGLVRKKILEVFFKGFQNNGAIFFLPDTDGMFSDIMLSANLDEAFNQYFHKYYHQFDPLHLMEGPPNRALVRPKPQRISYDFMLSTEYYNDFLKPQKIHYKLVVPLKSVEGALGKIVLTRPAGAIPFSETDSQMARTISPYLAQALSLNDLRQKISLNANILNLVEKDLSSGVMLMDKSMRLVYINPQAAELCRKFSGSARNSNDRPVPRHLLETISKMTMEIEHGPAGAEIIPKQNIIIGHSGVKLSVYAKFLRNGPVPGCDDCYMIYLSELKNGLSLEEDDIRRMFRLTPRELDVMRQVFNGLKNLEIAEKLFVSEITVKKHIQNIYAKVGVKNRTSLMNKIMDVRRMSRQSRKPID
jgi:DNA-binding CsgD family transcriptional regulator